MGALSNPQKARLATLARATWVRLGRPGENHDDWRRAQVKEACGADGLRAACNDDFNAIKAHFEILTGDTDRAFETDLRRQSEKKRQHIHNLGIALAKGDLTQAYAQKIAWDEFGHGLNDCTEAELLRLVMIVSARVRKKQGNHREGIAPARRDKKKRRDPLQPFRRPETASAATEISADPF